MFACILKSRGDYLFFYLFFSSLTCPLNWLLLTWRNPLHSTGSQKEDKYYSSNTIAIISTRNKIERLLKKFQTSNEWTKKANHWIIQYTNWYINAVFSKIWWGGQITSTFVQNVYLQICNGLCSGWYSYCMQPIFLHNMF